ncbi:MAG: hypothetical protein WC608_03575 [Parcubacteria group bacterium]
MQIDNLKIFSNFSPIIAQPMERETTEQFSRRWEKFDALPEKIKGKLSDPKVPESIKNLGKINNLAPQQTCSISRAIRSYYFGELKLEDMPAVLAKEIPIDLAKAREISRMVIQKIINDNSVEEASQAKLVQITVADALKAYPEIGEQLITSEKIVLKNFPEPARPCLKNWLADFTFTLGRDKHTAMDRGIYLFQSANGKRLNSQDRNKLAYILKAFDENLPISVNKDVKQIVFAPQPETQNLKPETQTPPTQGFSSDMHSGVRFSSAQKLPYEQKQEQPYVIKPIAPKQEENRLLQKNVVDLRE